MSEFEKKLIFTHFISNSCFTFCCMLTTTVYINGDNEVNWQVVPRVFFRKCVSLASAFSTQRYAVRPSPTSAPS
uniref:Uncharacterized protein n=1 Tax=Anguilla anguilla TaxID=7936 RepID=A0A0E9T056_ANGAN